MSRGPIIDTGLLDALGSGRAQGISVFQAVEQAREDERRREFAAQQQRALQEWRAQQQELAQQRVSLSQSKQEAENRQREQAAQQHRNDAAFVGGDPVGSMHMMGMPGADVPIGGSSVWEGMSPEVVRAAAENKARGQLESQRRAAEESKDYAEFQRRESIWKDYERSSGHEVDWDAFKASLPEKYRKFMAETPEDAAARHENHVKMLAEGIDTQVRRGTIDPDSGRMFKDMMLRDGADPKEVEHYVNLAMEKARLPKAPSDVAARRQAAATESMQLVDLKNHRATLAALIKRAEGGDSKLSPSEREAWGVGKNAPGFWGWVGLNDVNAKDVLPKMREKLAEADREISDAEKRKIGAAAGIGLAPASPSSPAQSRPAPASAASAGGANPSAKEEAKARFRAQNGRDPDPTNPTDVAAMKVIYRSVIGGG